MEEEKVIKPKNTQPLIIIGIILFILVLFGGFYYRNRPIHQKDTDTETMVSDKDYLYDKGIEFIKEKFHDLNTRKEQKDYQVFVSVEKFGITEKDNYNYVYMWVLSESYFVKDDQLFNGRSNSSFYRIIFLEDEIFDYDMPINGRDYEDTESYVMDKNYAFVKSEDDPESDFSKELKSLCGNHEIYQKIMDYDIQLSNMEQVKEKYSYLTNFTIHHESFGDDGGSSSDVPFPANEAHGGSGYVYEEW